MNFDNRREAIRTPLSCAIRYQRKGSQKFGNSIGRDISQNGIGFISNEYFPVRTHLVFEVQHPETKRFIKAVGEVVWASSQPYSERFSVGAKFLGPPITI